MNRYIAALLGLIVMGVQAASNGVAAGTTNTLTQAPVTVTNAMTKASTAAGSTFWDQYGSLIITAAVIGAVFAFLWSKGYLVRIRNFVEETKEELRKCTWPTVQELKGSTVVVMLTIAILGAFTIGVDWVLATVMRLITA